jgi:hypothetical protein
VRESDTLAQMSNLLEQVLRQRQPSSHSCKMLQDTLCHGCACSGLAVCMQWAPQALYLVRSKGYQELCQGRRIHRGCEGQASLCVECDEWQLMLRRSSNGTEAKSIARHTAACHSTASEAAACMRGTRVECECSHYKLAVAFDVTQCRQPNMCPP